FGGGNRKTKKWFAQVVYEGRTKSSLSRCIKKHIKLNWFLFKFLSLAASIFRTLPMSDMFKPYVTEVQNCFRKGAPHTLENNKHLPDMSYSHQWLNHTHNFVDPSTNAQSNPSEGVWEVKGKARMKCERGMRKTVVPSYLDEWLCRSWYFEADKNKTLTSEYFHGLVDGIKAVVIIKNSGYTIVYGMLFLVSVVYTFAGLVYPCARLPRRHVPKLSTAHIRVC
ncbi:hypothetical protein PHMEG_00011952, partial [Phytophthora megakarya]